MDETLLSVGLDVGTTSTQMIVSRLTVSNRASSFAVPEMEIGNREILYRSGVHFTPLLEGNLVDGDKIRAIVEQEYKNAHISRADVDTGAVIITGETSRRENAKAVLSALSEYAGDFVVATAGPSLESILAARGAGAVAYSQETGKRVFHMDIGGGTSNLALIEKGEILCTDCLNVGGRLIKLDSSGKILYLSPVLKDHCAFSVGDTVTPEQLQPVISTLVEVLEMSAGLRTPTALLDSFRSAELGKYTGCTVQNATLSFSGGVADCIETAHAPFAFGDIGPLLGQAIRQSRLCQGDYRLGAETIRATVIGAGCHSAQLSGSTVFCKDISLPVKNLPVTVLTQAELSQTEYKLTSSIAEKLSQQDSPSVLALPTLENINYSRLKALAFALSKALPSPMFLAMEQDMAKALGQAISLENPQAQVLCIDRIRLSAGDYLDVGKPVGPAFPVVVKTLILER